MTYTDQEKLDILKELVNMAHADGFLKKEEIAFIETLANRLEIEPAQVHEVLEHPERWKIKLPDTLTKRIVHFHRMMLMMHIDGEINLSELQLLHEVGLRYGIRRATIATLLDTMQKYPHGEIPPSELVGIHLRDSN